MNVWVIANPAKNAGKTTTSVTLAGELVSEGSSVLLIETDTQGNIRAFFKREEVPDDGLHKLFVGDIGADISALFVATGIDELSVMTAGAALEEVCNRLLSQQGKGLVLKEFLIQCEERFDHVLIDCSTRVDLLTVNALAACDLLIAPVRSGDDDQGGLDNLLKTAAMVDRSRGRDVDVLVVPVKHNPSADNAEDAMVALKLQFGDKLWDGFIPDDASFASAADAGKPLSLQEPSAPGAVAYRQLRARLGEMCAQ